MPNQQLIQVKNTGLHTAPNELSAVPEGALLLANNCVINDQDILESRRGNQNLFNLPLAGDRAARYEFFQTKQIIAYSGGKIGYENGGFTPYSGSFSDIDAALAKRRFLKSANNLFITTSTGIFKTDAFDTEPSVSGMFKGLDIQATQGASGGFVPKSVQVAYRVIWGLKDANENLILGAPSGREVYINTSNQTRDVDLILTIPDGVTTSHFFQIYRSKDSGGVAIEPSDELGLVYENSPTAGEITAGIISITDQTPDDLLGATLYTSPSQEGILQGNERPPLAWDFAEFEGVVAYANTVSKHRLFFTMVSADTIVINDTITIAGTTYSAENSEDAAADEYLKETSGTPAQNIADTARSLIRVINRSATNTTVYAYYLSGPDELPGQILVEERGVGGASFSITASANGTAFTPVLPTSGTSVASDNDVLPNQIVFSKTGQPEAVPILNSLNVGTKNDRILRIIALRNSLFVFKEQEGIFRVTGTSPETFAVELFDSSVSLLAPDSLGIVNNQVWGLSDQGIVRVTETGVSVVSRPIEDLILAQFGNSLAKVKDLSFGIGYETDRKYILFTISDEADTAPTQAFVFNVFTESYTVWPISKTAGIVNVIDDKLYLGAGGSNSQEVERKNLDFTDYIDDFTNFTINSVDGVNVFMASTTGINVGDLFFEDADTYAVVLAVEAAFVTITHEVAWTLGTISVFAGIDCKVRWAPVVGDGPGTLKQFPEISMLFREAQFPQATVVFATDNSPGEEEVSIVGDTISTWGSFPWGEGIWGGPSQANAVPLRTYVPRNKQRGSLIRIGFNHRNGYGNFKLNGFSLAVRLTGSPKITR